MKRLLGAFLALIILFLPSGSAGANGPVPHEDPRLTESQDASLLQLLADGDIIGQFDLEGKLNTAELMEQWKDSLIPGYFQLVMWRYRALLLDLDQSQVELDRILEATEYSLDQGQREQAMQRLREARSSLSFAELRVVQLKGATQVLDQRLGRLGSLENSPLEPLQVQQEALLVRLEEPEAGYRKLRGELTGVTELEFQTPPIAYPGLPFQVRGDITTYKDAPLWPRGLQVRLDGELLGEFEVGGAFDVTVKVPDRMQPGLHRLSLEVVPKDDFQATSQDRPLNVTQVDTEVRVEGSRLVFLPGQIRVEGIVRSEMGELDGATVKVQMGEASAEAISHGGRFAATLAPSWDPLVIGPQKIRLWVEPREPWNTSAIGELRVVVINWVDIGLVSILMVSMLLAVTIPQTLRKRKEAPPDLVPPDTAQRSLLYHPGEPEAKMPKEPPQHVITAYYRAVVVVAERTGETMKPFYTLTEFLNRVQETAVGEPFARITALAERDLYGGLPLAEGEVDEVKRLVGELEMDVAS